MPHALAVPLAVPLAVHPRASGTMPGVGGAGAVIVSREVARTGAAAAADVRAEIERLFVLHHGEIHAYLVRMMREPETAADMAQETFIKAYRAYASLEDPANARAWLYRIAHRIALDELRRRRIVRFLPWTGESRGSSPSAERLVMDVELSGDLARALARIPERQRAALLLAEVHDLTGLELAAALGVSHVAARALLTRARESLRRALADEREHEAAADRERDATATREPAAALGREADGPDGAGDGTGRAR